MPPQITTYVTWAQVNSGKASSLAEFREYLSKYSRGGVVYLCSVLNSLLNSFRDPDVSLDAHSEFLSNAFPPPFSERFINAIKDRQSSLFVFHRQQLLFLAKEAILCCEEGGLDPLSLPFWGKLGIALLMANDHLHFDQRSSAPGDAELIVMLPNLLLAQEYSGRNLISHRVVRSHLMYTRFTEALNRRPDYVGFGRVFEGLSGLSLVEFEALCWATLSKYLKVDLAAFKANPASFQLLGKNFEETAVPAVKVEGFMEEVSGTAETFRKEFSVRNASLLDFTRFRNKPFFRRQDALFPLDLGLLAEKIETGPFWRVFASLPDKRSKTQLHAFWGHIFEEYLGWLFSGSLDGGSNIYHHSPRYISDGNQACDGIIMCGSVAVIMEYKGSTFTAEGKYGGNGELLVREIKKKLVIDEGERKGVSQLAEAIHRMFDRHRHEEVDNVDLSSVKTVFPLLVTRDEIGGIMGVNYLLNREFQKILDKRRVRPRKVTPLFCLNADEIEYVSAYLGTVPLWHILQDRYDADNSLKTPLEFWDLPSLSGNLRNNRLKQVYEEFSDGARDTLFPDATPFKGPSLENG